MDLSANIYPAIIIIGTLIFFYIYFYLAHSDFIKKRTVSESTLKSEIRLFLTKKILGFTFLGIIPGIIYLFISDSGFERFGCNFEAISSNILIFIILIVIILSLLFINQKNNPENSSLQINYANWNLYLYMISSFGWIIYLIAYEFLFRGILLWECFDSFGFWPAIAINIVIYSAIHMVSGKEQAIGALIFGFIACYFTLTRETILIPIIMHITLSLGSDFFVLKINPNLKYNKQKLFNLPE